MCGSWRLLTRAQRETGCVGAHIMSDRPTLSEGARAAPVRTRSGSRSIVSRKWPMSATRTDGVKSKTRLTIGLSLASQGVFQPSGSQGG
jgi:hypothetical protein